MSAEDYFDFNDAFDQIDNGLDELEPFEFHGVDLYTNHEKIHEINSENIWLQACNFSENNHIQHYTAAKAPHKQKERSMSELTQKENVGIVEYSPVESRLSELREKYSQVPDAETKEGYEFCRLALRELVSCRTDIEKARKDLKASILERGRFIDGEAKRITAVILELEEPIKEAKSVIDERKKREKEEAERKERERVLAIENTIANFERVPMQAIGKTTAQIQNLIDQAESYEVKESDFQEFTKRAEDARVYAISQLSTLKAQAEAKEKAEQDLQAEKARIDAERAEFEKARAELEAMKAEAQKTAQAPEVIQTTEQAVNELKDGVVTSAGDPVKDEAPEEQAATALAFTCSLGNEQAREIVAIIKTGNIPFLKFEG